MALKIENKRRFSNYEDGSGDDYQLASCFFSCSSHSSHNVAACYGHIVFSRHVLDCACENQEDAKEKDRSIPLRFYEAWLLSCQLQFWPV